MAKECTNCGSKSTRNSTNEEYYFSGKSHYCNQCEEVFTPEDYEDNRESSVGLQTSRTRLDYESDEDYEDRMEDLDNN